MIALLALSVLAPARAAGSTTCIEDWWRERAVALADEPDDPHGMLALRQILDQVGTTADPPAVFEELERLRRVPGLDPLLAAELDLALLADDVRRERPESAAARRSRLGLFARAALAGPFPSEDEALALARDPSADGGEPFRVVPADPTGRFPLGVLLHPSSRGHAVVVFYVEAARAVDVAVRWGADDRARLLVDGHELARDDGPRSLAFDQSAAFVRLAAGVHRIAFVVAQDGGPWGLIARVGAPGGGPASGIEPAADPLPSSWEPRVDRSAPAPRAIEGRTLVAELERLAERTRSASRRARTLAALALELRARSLPTRDAGRALELAREAVRLRPSDPDVEWAAAIVETEPSRVRETLERLLSFEPEHPAALRRLALYALDHGDAPGSLAWVRRARDACPQPDPFLDAHEAITRNGPGFAEGALAALLRALERAPRQPALLSRAADLAQRGGRIALARALLERRLALDVTDAATGNALLSTLGAAGDRAGLSALFARLLAARPLSPGLRERYVQHLVAEGDLDAAGAALDEALALFGDRPSLLVLAGEHALALGLTGRAVDLFRRARAAGGPEEPLERRIAELTGERDLGVARWRVPVDEVLARHAARGAPSGDTPAAEVLHETIAYRVDEHGIGSKLYQVVARVHRAEQAGSARVFSITYSPRLERPHVIEARAIRRDGTVVLAGRSDQSLLPDLQLRMWYDARVLTIGFPRLEDGDLIEVCYVTRTRGPANPIADGYYGDVQLLGGPSPVRSARVVIDAPAARPLRHRLLHLPAPASERVEEADGRRVTVIELPELPGYHDAPLAPPPTERVPYVVVGTVDDWTQLGRMYARLVEPQTTLTPDVADTVDGLVRGTVDRRRIVEKLYEWVIENTRYVALEFGIHALKPYDVDTVFRRRHGDCKDKATLLVAMLRRAGIPADLVLLRTRDRGAIDTAIPTFAHFNHAIVHVPFEDLWLDGTVQHFAAGEVPLGDLGALVLRVDPFGERDAALGMTPAPEPEDAHTRLEQRLEIDADGKVSAAVTVIARGADAARERYYFRRAPIRTTGLLQTRLRALHPDVEVRSSRLVRIGLDEQPVRYEYKARFPRLARPEGSGRLSIPLFAELEHVELPVPQTGRDVPLQLPDPFLHEVEVEIEPTGDLAIADLPPSREIVSPWGRLELQTRRNGAGARVSLRARFAGGTVPLDRIEEYARFAVDVNRALGERITLEAGR
ncbi:MAG: hypothetical protein Kow0062_06220 [Acidobacteriota bacterium]